MNRLGARWASLTFPVLFLLFWEGTVLAFNVPPTVFPSPSATVWKLAELLAAGELDEHLAATITRLLLAFLLAALPGVSLGLILGLMKPIRRLLDPYVALLYTVPKVAILPLVMIILGANEQAFILTASLSAFAQITVSTMTGVMTIDPILIEAGHNYGARGVRLYTKVILPATLPAAWTGLRLGLGLALILVIAVEFITANSGLGHLVWRYWNMLLLAEMYAALILISMLGVIVTSGLLKLGHLLMPWTPRD